MITQTYIYFLVILSVILVAIFSLPKEKQADLGGDLFIGMALIHILFAASFYWKFRDNITAMSKFVENENEKMLKKNMKWIMDEN